MAKWGIQGETGSLGQIQVGHNNATMTQIMTSSASGVELKNINSLTASYAKITELDVYTINSIAQTNTTLEVVDKIITVASGASAANTDGAGLKFGGTDSDTVASMKYDHANSAIDFNIGGTTQVRLADGAFRPESDSDVDLGASGVLFKNLYVDSFGANWTNAGRTVADLGTITTADINGGSIDGTTIGAASPSTAVVTTLSGSGAANLASLHCDSVNLDGGNIDGVTIGAASAAAGTFAALVGTTVSGSGAAQFASVHCDSVNIDGGNIDGTAIGAASRSTAQFTTINANSTSTLAAVTATTLSGSGAANLASLHCDSVNLDGGNIDGTIIGAASAAAVTATTVAGTSFSGSSFVSASSFTIGEDSATIDYSTSLDLSLGSTKYAALSTNHFSASVELQGPSLEVSGAAQVGSLASSGAITGTTVSGSGAAQFASLHSDSVNIDGGNIDGTIIGAASAAAGTFTTVSAGTSLALASGATVTGIADEDGMGSNSATLLATQQSIKAYVDAQVTAQDLDFQGDSGGALNIDLDSETLDIAGGTNVSTVGSSNTLTVNLDSALSALTTVTGSGLFTAGAFTCDGAATVGSVASTAGITATTVSGSGAAQFASMHSDSVNIDGGAIDGTAIGAASRSTGAFTTLSGSGAAQFASVHSDSVNIDGGNIDGTAIGAASRSTAQFTTINANSTSTLAAVTATTVSGSGAAQFASLNVSDGNITNVGSISLDSIAADDGSSFSFGSNWTAAGRTCANLGTVSAATSVTSTTFADGTATLTGGVLTGLSRIGANGAPVTDVYATNVYTGDFHMKNERGDWTLFEESDHIRIRNNTTGQVFKMAMTLVDEE
jgi:hypothetical protein